MAIYDTIGTDKELTIHIQYVLQDINKERVEQMILTEINRALTYLLSDENESVIISDTDSFFAQEVVYYLTELFKGLKCDFRVNQLSDQSYEVVLYH